MLVLSRKRGEKLIIDDEVEVTVLSISGSTVKLGFTGPLDVQILRKEILDRMQAAEAVPQLELPHSGI